MYTSSDRRGIGVEAKYLCLEMSRNDIHSAVNCICYMAEIHLYWPTVVMVLLLFISIISFHSFIIINGRIVHSFNVLTYGAVGVSHYFNSGSIAICNGDIVFTIRLVNCIFKCIEVRIIRIAIGVGGLTTRFSIGCMSFVVVTGNTIHTIFLIITVFTFDSFANSGYIVDSVILNQIKTKY